MICSAFPRSAPASLRALITRFEPALLPDSASELVRNSQRFTPPVRKLIERLDAALPVIRKLAVSAPVFSVKLPDAPTVNAPTVSKSLASVYVIPASLVSVFVPLQYATRVAAPVPYATVPSRLGNVAPRVPATFGGGEEAATGTP